MKFCEFEIFFNNMNRIGFSLNLISNDSSAAVIQIEKIPKILAKKFNSINQKDVYMVLNGLIQNQLKVNRRTFLNSK